MVMCCLNSKDTRIWSKVVVDEECISKLRLKSKEYKIQNDWLEDFPTYAIQIWSVQSWNVICVNVDDAENRKQKKKNQHMFLERRNNNNDTRHS